MDLSHLDLTAIIGSIPSPVLSLALGVGICFMGYRLRQAGIMLAGALIGYLITYDVASMVLDGTAAMVAAVVVALLLAAFCSWLYDAGVFVLCGGCAALLASGYLMQLPLDHWLQLGILVLLFVAAGILGVKLDQPAMIVITGFAGSSCLLSSLGELGWMAPEGTARNALLLIVAIIGISIQFANTHD